MARLSALLPVAQGVAAYAALCKAADITTAAGDERGRGQIMADTLVERVIGQATASAVAVEIELIMTDSTLFATETEPTESTDRTGTAHEPDTSDEPAVLVGFGPIPAGLARALALGSDDDSGPRWLRRLFLRPTTGQLAAMESTRRLFPEAQRRFIRLRDQHCRTPWCGAPIRHTDHVRAHGAGGGTAVRNGAGLCAACNYAKEAAGWSASVDPVGTITTETPTGHRYRSQPPDPPGSSGTPMTSPGINWRVHTRFVDLAYHHADAA